MKFPKLKNALLCRILPYVIFISAVILPIIAVVNLPIPDGLKILFIFFWIILGLVFIAKNFVLLMMADMLMGTIHCYNRVRTKYPVPKGRTDEKIKKSLSRYGKECSPRPLSPKPEMLRYKLKSSMTVFTKGIEHVAAVYNIENLNKQSYNEIYTSAQTNSKALEGMKKPIITDKSQKKAPLSRVMVAIIFAEHLEENFRANIQKTLEKGDGDETETAFIPCIIDLEKNECFFDSLEEVNMGFGNPVKNRGIKLVKRYVFGNKISIKNNENRYDIPNLLEDEKFKNEVQTENILDMTLWELLKMLKKSFADSDKETQKTFESMKDGEVVSEEDGVFVKLNGKGIHLYVEGDEGENSAQIEAPYIWDYPKSNKVSQKDMASIERMVMRHYSEKGVSIKFDKFEE